MSELVAGVSAVAGRLAGGPSAGGGDQLITRGRS